MLAMVRVIFFSCSCIYYGRQALIVCGFADAYLSFIVPGVEGFLSAIEEQAKKDGKK